MRHADGRYKQHIANVVAKVLRRVGISLRAFTRRNVDFMHRLLMSYVRPQLKYATVAWSPLDVAPTSLLEAGATTLHEAHHWILLPVLS